MIYDSTVSFNDIAIQTRIRIKNYVFNHINFIDVVFN